jgi:hypothetical protein
MPKYTKETFILFDDAKFNKWINENQDYNLSSNVIDEIYKAELALVEFNSDVYKGLTLIAGGSYSVGNETINLSEKDVEGYFSKYPHHDKKLSDQTVKEYISLLQEKGTILNSPEEQAQDDSEKDSMPSEQTEDELTDEPQPTQNKVPETTEAQLLEDNSSTVHFHYLELDDNGNGWTKQPMTTNTIQSSPDIFHIHEVINYVVQDEIWVKEDKTATPLPQYNFSHSHGLKNVSLSAGAPADPSEPPQEPAEPPKDPNTYRIRIKLASYPGEPVKYRFLVGKVDPATGKALTNFLSETIPGSATTQAGITPESEEETRNLAKAFLLDLREKYPNYVLDDMAGLLADTGGNLEITPGSTTSPENPEPSDDPQPVRVIEFNDERYSERLFIGINNISNKSPWDSSTAMGYLLFSDKIIRDAGRDSVDWTDMILAYTFPEPVIKPTASPLERDKKPIVPKAEDFESSKGDAALLKQNQEINDPEVQFQIYLENKAKKLFVGNTLFADLESGITKLRGHDNAFVSIYGEVLHRVNIRELLMRAMACIVAKLNPGEWVEIACKAIIKEVAKQIGFETVKREILNNWNTLVKSLEGTDAAEALEKVKKNLEKAEKSGALVDRRLGTDLVTPIDGKDPFSKEFGAIQQRELDNQKNYLQNQKTEIDDFVKDIKDIIDLDKLCEKFGDFINDSMKLLFAPGGLGNIREQIIAYIREKIPKVPTIQFPVVPTKDIMAELRKAFEKAAKELIVQSIVDLIRGIIDEALAQCEDIENPPPALTLEKSFGIPDLVPNRHGAAAPLKTPNGEIPLQFNDISGLDIPAYLFVDVKDLLDWISQYLKPVQLCKLLSGAAGEGLLKIVLEQVEQKYERLNVYVKTTSHVKRLFALLGAKVDQTFCGAIVTNVSAIADLCEDVIDNSLHENALIDKGFSQAEINKILEDEKQRKFDALEKLAEYFTDPTSIETQVPPVLCTPTKKGLVDRIPQALQYQIDNVVDTVFESVKYVFEEDVTNLKESYIQLALVTTDRFKEPKPGEDYSDEFMLYPISTFFLKTDSILNFFGLGGIKEQLQEFVGGPSKKTGKYFLLEATQGDIESIGTQIKEIVDNKIISSDGTSRGLFGPVFEKEQRRVVLPRVQELIQNAENFISTTHYKFENEKAVLATSIDPEKDIDVNISAPYPMSFKITGNLFDFTSIKQVIAQLQSAAKAAESEGDDERSAELSGSAAALNEIISGQQTIPEIVNLKQASVANSVFFDENNELSLIKFQDLYKLNRSVIPSYEEKVLGSMPELSTQERTKVEVINSGQAQMFNLIKNTLTDDFDGKNLFDTLYPEGKVLVKEELGIESKNTFKSFKALLFSKLLSKKLKNQISSFSAADPNNAVLDLRFREYIYYLDNYLMSQYEKSFVMAIAGGFNSFKQSPILDTENFKSLDLTPEDPNTLLANKCLPDGSAGVIDTLDLIDVENTKQIVKENFQFKSCQDRAPDELNPLKEAMLEAGIMNLIKLGFIEYCMNNLIALTDSNIYDSLVTDSVVRSSIENTDLFLRTNAQDMRDSVYNTLVDFYQDQLDLNIDIPDPFDPENADLFLTEENLNTYTALEYMCKSMIVETVEVIERLIVEELTFENPQPAGLEGFLSYYLGSDTVLDSPSELYRLTTSGLDDLGIASDSETIDGHTHLARIHGSDPINDTGQSILAETGEYSLMPNVVLDKDYHNNLTSYENDSQAGTFFLEKYVKINYGDSNSRRHFFLPEMFLLDTMQNYDHNLDANDLSSRKAPGTLYPFKVSKNLEILSLKELEKIILLQRVIAHMSEKPSIFTNQASDLDEENIFEMLKDMFGLDKAIYDKFKDYINSSFTNDFEESERLTFSLGMRLVYKTPSEPANSSKLKSGKFSNEAPIYKVPLAAGVVEGGIVDFIKSSKDHRDLFKNKVNARNEDVRIVRTIRPSSLSNFSFTFGDADPTTVYLLETEGSFDSSNLRAVDDHMLFTVAQHEVPWEEMNNLFDGPGDRALYNSSLSPNSELFSPKTVAGGYFSLGNRLGKLLGPAAPDSGIDDLKIITGASYETHISSPLKTFRAKQILDAHPDIEQHLGLFDKHYENNYKAKLFEELKKKPEVELLTKHLFNPQEIKTLTLDYMNLMPKSDSIDNSKFFLQSKKTLNSLFRSTILGEDYRYTDPDSDGIQKQKQNSRRKSTLVNPLPAIQKLALQTGPMIAKGLAETIDPAVVTAKYLSLALGIDPNDINKVILGLIPPPLFPPLGFNNIPITPLGISYMGLNFAENLAEHIKKTKKVGKDTQECEDIVEEDEENEDPESEDYQTKK